MERDSTKKQMDDDAEVNIEGCRRRGRGWDNNRKVGSGGRREWTGQMMEERTKKK